MDYARIDCTTSHKLFIAPWNHCRGHGAQYQCYSYSTLEPVYLPETQGGLAHLPSGNARTLCTARAFLILSLTTKVPTGLRDNCPFTFPPPILFPTPWQSSPSTSHSVPPSTKLK